VRRHPKLTTQAVNVGSALVAFSQEIGAVVRNFQNGTWFANPEAALNELLAVSTGVHTDGTINIAQTTTSATAKIGGYALNKVAKFFLRKFRM